MIYDIFVNIAIVLAFLLVIGQIFKNNTFDFPNTLKTQTLLGIVLGILGITLMLFAIKITDIVMIDLRNISIMFAGILAGPLAAIISSLMIAWFRILYFGLNTASVIAHFSAIILGIGVAYICNKKISRLNKLGYMFLILMLIANSSLIYTVKDKAKLIESLTFFWTIYLFGTAIAYFTCEYIISANTSLKMIKENQEELKASNARLKAIFDSAAMGMYISSLEGSFTNVNPALCDILGYTKEEFLDMKFDQIIYPDDLDEDIISLKELLTGQVPYIHAEKRFINKNGEIIWALLGLSVLYDMEGKPQNLIGQIQDITQRKYVEEELEKAKLEAEKLASTDYLTGILNRRAFEDRFNEEIHRAVREGNSISLILTDIDEYKKINDTYGHQAGDYTLQKFTQCLISVCRPYDIIGRHGGEEFIICLPNTNDKQAKVIAERIRMAVEELSIKLVYLSEPIKITASFGITSPKNGAHESIDTLIMQADKAMYKAKAHGRNVVCTYGEE